MTKPLIWTDPTKLFSEDGEVRTIGKPAPTRRKPETRVANGFYTVQQLARAWGLSEDYVRKLFRDEPDVVKLQSRKKGKRGYRTLRIPPEVAERVRRRLTAC